MYFHTITQQGLSHEIKKVPVRQSFIGKPELFSLTISEDQTPKA